MKKLFLIPLLTLMCSVMAMATVRTASTFAELQDAISASVNGDEIQLTADIAYPANGALLNVTKNLTIDGQGHTLSGYAKRNDSAYPTIGINVNNTANETELTLKNITIENDRHASAYQCRPIEARGHVKSITLENVIVNAPYGDVSNAQVITIGGNDNGWCSETKKTEINMTNTKIYAGKSSYCITSFNPYKLKAENCEFHGWCVADLAMPSGSFGSRYSVLTFDACLINTYNKHITPTNSYAAFSLRDDGITINLNGCTMNATELGSQSQCILLLNNFAPADRRNKPVVLNITGDNSNLSDALLSNGWTGGYYSNAYYGESVMPETFSLTVNISGGTYPFNPAEIGWFINGLLDGEEKYAESNIGTVTIPEGYEVTEVKQDTITLYRVVKKAATKEVEIDDPENPGQTITVEVLYDLNDNVQGVDSGNNPVTSFDLCTGDTMQLKKETTTAGYVQIQNNVETDAQGDTIKNEPTTIQIGKTEVNTETQQEEKVDQTLVINNGLDVQGDSKVEVQAGSALVIGEGGINTEKPENIVIEADKEGAASLLLHPAITVNQTPELTVKMTAKQIGKVGADYFWHRFAMPVDAISSLPRDTNVVTKIFGWDYENEDWKSLSTLADLKPFYGYTLTTTADRLDVTYTFKGHLVGNLNETLNFTDEGYNFFGNSYTGYIDIVSLADQLLDHADIDAAVWVWNTDEQNYKVVTLGALKETPSLFPKWQREIAPMQTFILRLATPGVTSASTVVDYKSAIWDNPRYGNGGGAGAPARKNAFEGNAIRMTVAANGMSDEVLFIEKANFSDEFDKGYDGTKYMNTEAINIYSTVNNENYSAVATDQIEGKMLTIETVNDVNYTISFDVVLGETEYALRDNATNKVIAIEEGASYEFAAQPNSTVEGRFEIVDRANVVTSIDNAQDNKANVKGIYTIMGQYVGENFDVLPTGVYVVDGVKIVK